jgi:glycosyltransferase involved in cell wall biosynthesis
VEESPHRERIDLLGYISDEALAELYARAMIFAFPSLDEGFGMPVLEAMAAGLPVVTSNCSALPEVCGDAALLVDPHDVGMLADALRDLTRKDSLRADMARRGFERVAAFTWEKALEGTWAAYRQVLG